MQIPSLFRWFLHEASAEEEIKVKKKWIDLKSSVEPLDSVVVSMIVSVLLAGVVVGFDEGQQKSDSFSEVSPHLLSRRNFLFWNEIGLFWKIFAKKGHDIKVWQVPLSLSWFVQGVVMTGKRISW